MAGTDRLSERHMNLSTGDLQALLSYLELHPPVFGPRDPEVQTIMMAVLRMDNRVRPLGLHRFSYPSYLEPGRDAYNINRVPDSNLFMSEGPAPVRYSPSRESSSGIDSTSMARFFSSTLFHESLPIQRVMVAGLAEDGAGFENYFSGDRLYDPEIQVTLEDAQPATPARHIARYELKVHQRLPNQTRTRGLEVFQLTQMPDFGVPKLTDLDLQQLHQLFRELPQNPTNIHCAAGLGRTGLLTLTWCLWKDFDSLLALPDVETRGVWVLERLKWLRRVRPGVVQTPAQLQQALVIANTLHSP